MSDQSVAGHQVIQRLIAHLKSSITQTHATKPRIGGHLAGQGGIYDGNFLCGDGTVFGLIASTKVDRNVDFYLPARCELLIATANVPHLFNKDGWY